MYTISEIQIIMSSCATWRQLQDVCDIFDWLIKNNFIPNDSTEKEIIRIHALYQVNNIENFDE